MVARFGLHDFAKPDSVIGVEDDQGIIVEVGIEDSGQQAVDWQVHVLGIVPLIVRDVAHVNECEVATFPVTEGEHLVVQEVVV